MEMCKHRWIKINNVDVCTKCGLTICDGKFILIDKKFISKIGKKVK